MLYTRQMGIKDDVVEATLRVIAAEGFRAVTIRRVAAEVGRSTTAITHYFADRDALLRKAVSGALEERRVMAESVIRQADDPVWAFLEWSIDADPVGVWAAVIAASVAGIEPEIVDEARRFDAWWTTRLAQLLDGRCARGVDPALAADAIGVAVDGFVLGLGVADVNTVDRRRLLHLLVDPLVHPMGTSPSRSGGRQVSSSRTP